MHFVQISCFSRAVLENEAVHTGDDCTGKNFLVVTEKVPDSVALRSFCVD